MRFGFKTSPQSTTWDDLLAVWKAADDIELFESGWTFDHFEPIFSDRSGPCLEGWITLTALAQATTRLRVGVLVTGVPYRHPAVLANMAATLDQISHGRLELGLGAGWNTDEANAYGIDLLDIKDRMDRFDEACDVIVSLLTQERSTYAGTHYALDEAYCEPKAIQQPHPPICIGGSGEKRTLRTVARVAQHWNYVGGPVAEFERLKGVIAEHLRGKISYITHLKGSTDPVVRSLATRFNKNFGARPIKLAPTIEEQRDRAVWLVEHSA